MQLDKICGIRVGQAGRAKGAGLANDTEKRMNRVDDCRHDTWAGDLSLHRLAEAAAQTVERLRLHRAAYDQLFGRWLPGSEMGLADSPIFERHLNSAMDTAPEDLVTEICALLK